MTDDTIEVGDRVINLQTPGIFTVVARDGNLVTIETDTGLRMRMVASAVRRVDGTPPIPADTDDEE